MLNLDAFQGDQARTKREQADDTVDARIQEAYIWLLVPDQADPRDPKSLEWQESRLQGRDPLAVRASKRLKGDEYLIDAYSARSACGWRSTSTACCKERITSGWRSCGSTFAGIPTCPGCATRACSWGRCRTASGSSPGRRISPILRKSNL